jgi:quercetin 2,3-dioxygenase
VVLEEKTMTDAAQGAFEVYANREVKLGELEIARAMPIRGRRMVGPWCFLDRFGPLAFNAGRPLDVAPHPHIGLQTVTWLLSGEVRHDDTLGYEAVVRPGGVNVMTAGAGIAHAERTPSENTGRLSGIQLWAALPDEKRGIVPNFEAIAAVPEVALPGGVARLFAGELAGFASPATHYSPILGVDLSVHAGQELGFDLPSAHEHALLLLEGELAIEGTPLPAKHMAYMGPGRSAVSLASEGGGRVLLIGGAPFGEEILMWWNFVARTPEEIAAARDRWVDRQFGEVTAYDGPRIEAPDLGKLAPANPVS